MYQQSTNVIALAFGLVPEEERQNVFDALAFDVRETWDGHVSVGAVGLRMLTEGGYGDLAPLYRKIEIKPTLVGDLTDAGACFKTPLGTVSTAWEITGGNVVDLGVTTENYHHRGHREHRDKKRANCI